MTRRGVAIVALTGLVLAGFPAVASAHGIGGRQDLPVPLNFFIGGAALAIIFSFVALAYLWPEPRWQEQPTGRPLETRWLAPMLRSLKWVGLAGLGLVVADGLVDGRYSSSHISPVLVWVVFWLVIPYLVAAAGNLWTFLNPWRTIGRWVSGDVAERPDLELRLGVWPATVLFVAFTWLELVSPNSGDPKTLAVVALVYTVIVVGVSRFMGVETAMASVEVFETYNTVLASISPIGLESMAPSVGAATTVEKPTAVWRGWLRALPSMPIRRGMTWFILATIGTVTYDGLSATIWWSDLFGGFTVRRTWFGSLALVAIVLIVGGGYMVACWAAARLATDSGRSVSEVANSFIHTLVPIALAYAFSHYFTLVLFEGQLLLHRASDPFGLDWNLFGTADWRVVFFLSPLAVWWVQLVAIVTGHIAGTVLAHDRALAMFGRDAVRSQYAMLALMVGLTSLGLFILAG